MKYLVLLFAIFLVQSTVLFAQEKRQVTFEDGKVLDYSFYFDKPYDIYDWSISASLGILTLEENFLALILKPYYEINEKLFFDSKIAISLAGGSPNISYEPLAKPYFEFFPEIHYELFNKGKQKQANLWLESNKESIDVTLSYNTKLDYVQRQSIYLDGGLDIGSMTGERVVRDDPTGDLVLISQRYAALSIGISRRASNNYKVSVSRGGARYFSKTGQLSIKALFGSPLSPGLATNKITTVNGLPNSELVLNPTDYSELNKRNIGVRVSFDREKSFARKPNIFLTWGIGLGLNPAFLSDNSTFADSEGVYSSMRIGLGFGKLTL
ncbi:MAG: hypothetical protein AB8B74_02185 [Crocinitomicaceae bacterium]